MLRKSHAQYRVLLFFVALFSFFIWGETVSATFTLPMQPPIVVPIRWGEGPARIFSGEVLKPRTESAETPNSIQLEPSTPILSIEQLSEVETRSSENEKTEDSNVSTQVVGESFGPNIIKNSSLETAASANIPMQWHQGGYGVNTRTLSYPVSGYLNTRGISVNITAYTNGDAKWYFDDVLVIPGETYEFSDYYKTTVGSQISIRYTLNNGSFAYQTLSVLSAQNTWKTSPVRFVVPGTAISATIFHLIAQKGMLTTDEYILRRVFPASTIPSEIPAGTDKNLVTNGTFEATDVNGLPLHWSKGGWGSNTAALSYPVLGVSGSKAVKVAVSAYTNGDTKWVFDDVPITEGVYTYRTEYLSTISSVLTTRFKKTDGSYVYSDIGTVPPSGVFAAVTKDFSVPAGVVQTTVFHLINSIGELTSDNVSLIRKETMAGVFKTGAISLTFDDGWLSQYTNALPVLDKAGLKGTFYIATRQLADTGFSGFVSKIQIADLYARGHEIGAHTRTHPFLPTLSESMQREEIAGSRQDLIDMNVGTILTFAYPFGEYDARTTVLVKEAGFASARSTIPGTVLPTSDRYQLAHFSMENNTTLENIKQAIDVAILNKQWLIFTFHQIDESGSKYSTRPALLQQMVDYMTQKKVSVIPVSLGVASMQ